MDFDKEAKDGTLLTDRQIELRNKFKEENLDLVWNTRIEENADNVFFFGGELCTVDSMFDGKNQARITVTANGNVCGNLYKDGECIDSFKDYGNEGVRHDAERYLSTNEDLAGAINNIENTEGYFLKLEESNWIELFYDWVEDGEVDPDYFESIVMAPDSILQAVDNADYFAEICHEICDENLDRGREDIE